MSARKKKVIQSLRRRAQALGIDVSGLTDEELERRIRENSRKLADRAVAGIRSAVKDSASRIAKLRSSFSDREENG